jgi:hypothetical protein
LERSGGGDTRSCTRCAVGSKPGGKAICNLSRRESRRLPERHRRRPCLCPGRRHRKVGRSWPARSLRDRCSPPRRRSRRSLACARAAPVRRDDRRRQARGGVLATRRLGRPSRPWATGRPPKLPNRLATRRPLSDLAGRWRSV